jgi:hypothetical protein
VRRSYGVRTLGLEELAREESGISVLHSQGGASMTTEETRC